MRCANPLCNQEALYYRDGSLHWISSTDDNDGAAYGEHSDKLIWLCSRCSEEMVVETWRPPGQQIRPRSRDNTVQSSGSCVPSMCVERSEHSAYVH